MKKTIFALLLLIYNLSQTTAQVERYAPIIAGTESSGQISTPSRRNASNFPSYRVFRFAPHVDVNLYKRFYVSLQVEYGFGEVENVKLIPQKGAGIGLKYYFKNNSANRLLRNRFMPYAELSWNILNYTIDYQQEYGYEPLEKFSNHNVQSLVGVNFRLFKNLYLDYALRGMYYSRNEKLLFAKRVGLQYHFGQTRRLVPQNRPIEKVDNMVHDYSDRLQPFDFRYFLKRTTLQVRYSFIFDYVNTGDIFYYKERSLPLALVTSLSSDLYFGFMYQPIWASVRNQERRQHFRAGPFLQYDFLRRPNERRLFAEFGFYKGDLCTCGEDLSYKKENLSYIPIGLGYENRINRTSLYWSVSLHLYRILGNAADEPGTYVHPTVGIAYRTSKDL
jgi:hypothetical protein